MTSADPGRPAAGIEDVPAEPERNDRDAIERDVADDADDLAFDEADDIASDEAARPARRLAGRTLLASALTAVLALAVGIGIGRLTAPGSDLGGSAATSAAPTDNPAGSGAIASTPVVPRPSGGASNGDASSRPLLGSPSAKVPLTYWADFQCPFCARFASQFLPALASRIADGTVSVAHRDFAFLGPESLDAAIAVRCAGEQGRYWPMHDTVYAMQAGENNGAFTVPHLEVIATAVGLDATAFSACMTRHDVLIDVLSETAAGVRSGVSSTPTVDLPGTRLKGVSDAAALVAAVDAAAAASAVPSAAATPSPIAVAPSGDPWATTPTDGRTAGKASARVTVELWVDYQAKGMPAVVSGLEPGLRARVASGDVRVELHDLATLGSESAVAASFVRCAAQDREPSVWFANDILAAAAQGADAGVFSGRGLLWLGAKLGYDVPALDKCMADPATATAISAETASGTALGLGNAPAVVVKAGGKEVARFEGPSLDAVKVLAAMDAAG